MLTGQAECALTTIFCSVQYDFCGDLAFMLNGKALLCEGNPFIRRSLNRRAGKVPAEQNATKRTIFIKQFQAHIVALCKLDSST